MKNILSKYSIGKQIKIYVLLSWILTACLFVAKICGAELTWLQVFAVILASGIGIYMALSCLLFFTTGADITVAHMDGEDD